MPEPGPGWRAASPSPPEVAMTHVPTRLPCCLSRTAHAARTALASATAAVLLCLPHAPGVAAEPSDQAERVIHEIYRLSPSGRSTKLSLHGIDWQPSHGAAWLEGERWFALLEPDADGSSLALASTSPVGTRQAVLGANPLHDLTRSHLTGGAADAATEAWFDNVVAWLLDDEMPFAPDRRSIEIVLAHLNGPDGSADDRITRRWLQSRAHHISLSAPGACEGPDLADCLADADLLLLGPGATPNGAALDAAITMSNAQHVPMLYLHEAVDGDDAAATLAVFGIDVRPDTDGRQIVRGSAPLTEEPTLAAARRFSVGRR